MDHKLNIVNVPSPLHIPELLRLIFSHLDKSDIANAACVCKLWYEISLDCLWNDVEDNRRLFSLLAGIGENHEFKRLPDVGDWKRFEHYGRRVRRLRFSSVQETALLKRVFDDIAMTRTSLNFLPNLNTLEWTVEEGSTLPLSVLFMHENVKNFVFYLPGVGTDPFFRDVITRMPTLTHLDIRTRLPIRDVEDYFVKLFQGLSKLHKVVFPGFHFTTRIAECLSKLENLGVIEFAYSAEQGCGQPADIMHFSPSLSDGAFPSLWDLSLVISFPNMTRFLNSPFGPTNITVLYVDSPLPEGPSELHGLLKTIADHCQLLVHLTLVPDIVLILEGTSPTKQEQITFETLKPILDCPNLIALDMQHRYPLDLRLENLEEIAVKWPSLEILVLNNEPAYLSTTLTLQSLLPFARHCPNLKHLGLFLDATTTPDTPSSLELPVFQSLTKLSMGVSDIDDDQSVALFLSQICPVTCEVDDDNTWDMNEEDAPVLANEISRRRKQWDRVGCLLPLLVKLRMQERERTEALEREVIDLRTRTGILMDELNMKNGGDRNITYPFWLRSGSRRHFRS